MKENTLSHIGEFGLIESIRKKTFLTSQVKLGIGDDAAVLEGVTKNSWLLFTTDMLVEGVHFLSKTLPQKIGHKALAVNISDIAAMGGEPLYAVVSLGLPKKTPVRFVNGIYEGMNRLAKRFGVAIVGGDTVRSKEVIINIGLIGHVEKRYLVKRRASQRGDLIVTTGPLGNSLKSGHHLSFTPRIKESRYLVKHCKPNAMIDISDGLIQDLSHLLSTTKLGAVLYKEKIPLRKGASLTRAFYDGEDFELLFTVPQAKIMRLKASLKSLRFSVIGEVSGKFRGICLRDRTGKVTSIPLKGFDHFK